MTRHVERSNQSCAAVTQQSRLAVNWIVLVCGPAPDTDAGVKVQVTPAGKPEADRCLQGDGSPTEEPARPGLPETPMLTLAEPPRAILTAGANFFRRRFKYEFVVYQRCVEVGHWPT